MSIAHCIATYIMYLNQHAHSSGHNFATKEMSLTSPMNTASLTEYSQMLKSLSEELEFQGQQMRQSYELKLRTMEGKLKERKQKLLERMSKSKLQPVSLLSDVMHDSANSTSTVITINASDVVRSTCISTTVLERKQLDAQQSVLSPAKHTTCTIDTECTGTLGSSTDHGSSIQGSQVSGVQTDMPLNDIKISTSMTETDVFEATDRHEYGDMNDVMPSSCVEILDNTYVYLKSHDSPLHVNEMSELSPPCYHHQIPQLRVDSIIPTSDLPVIDSVTIHVDATEPDVPISSTVSAAIDVPSSPEMYTFELFTPAFPRHLNYCMIVDQHAYFTLVPADDTIPSRMWLYCRILKILHSGELTTFVDNKESTTYMEKSATST